MPWKGEWMRSVFRAAALVAIVLIVSGLILPSPAGGLSRNRLVAEGLERWVSGAGLCSLFSYFRFGCPWRQPRGRKIWKLPTRDSGAPA